MRFIILTSSSGLKVRYNVSLIMRYYPEDLNTIIEAGDELFHVRESPDEIDTLLISNGVLVHGKGS